MDLLTAGSIDGSFVPRRSAVASVELDGETVLAGGRTRAYYRLDPVASLVWSCFDGSGTADEIARDLAAELQAPADVVRDDVVALTRTLGGLCFLDGVMCAEAETPVVHPVTLAGGPAPSGPRRVVEPPSG
ncbi:MAG TPA: PqqD family protein [Acidimicrobiales bacterium]|nr:PqqD family protein [Acidimicrobiales bacterium]